MPDLAPTTVLDGGRIVEEGISNAVRHGDALLVKVAVDCETTGESTALRITVTDDGRGVSDSPSRSGLGLRMIQTVADSWSLATELGHTTLTVRLALT
jgi:two-component sensor histidine kinase